MIFLYEEEYGYRFWVTPDLNLSEDDLVKLAKENKSFDMILANKVITNDQELINKLSMRICVRDEDVALVEWDVFSDSLILTTSNLVFISASANNDRYAEIVRKRPWFKKNDPWHP